MAKIKTVLKAEQYWEWRTTIAEMETAKQKYLRTEAELKLLFKDAELLSVRQKLFMKTNVDQARTEVETSRSEYDRIKLKLEEYLGQTLNNKAIDDVTFEVRSMPDETNQTP